MNNNAKPIHARMWSPFDKHLFKARANDPAECKVLYCEIPEQCSLLKLGQCINDTIMGPKCPYGYVKMEIGPTKRAKGCSPWIVKQKEQYKDVLNKVGNYPSSKIVEVGEYIYLPYPHADMNKEVPFLNHNLILISGQPFVKKELFTIDVILSIISFCPYAMMGGEITDYQLKIIPKFIVDLQEVFPKLYYELIKIRPDLEIKEKNFVGRKALLATVFSPSDVDMGGDIWKWNGEYLESTSKKNLPFTNIENRNGGGAIESVSIKIVPTKDAVAKIISNEQVSSETQFVD